MPGDCLHLPDDFRQPALVDHRLPEPEATVLRRRLNDGREFQIYKVFYDPADLTERLSKLGWQFDILHTDHYFLYGSGHRRNA